MPAENIENILSVYEQADQIDRDEGLLAYSRYNEVCRTIARRYDYPLELVIAVFAATSPNNDYKGNLRSTISIIEGHKTKKPLKQIKIKTYNHCRDRAFSYLNGVSFLETTKGEKIRSFYLNITDPSDPEPVTIDAHALNAWRNQLSAVKKARVTNYEIVADDFRRAARELDILPNQLQATTWFCWKRVNRILYKPQANLFSFRPGDWWGVLGTLDELKT